MSEVRGYWSGDSKGGMQLVLQRGDEKERRARNREREGGGERGGGRYIEVRGKWKHLGDVRREKRKEKGRE